VPEISRFYGIVIRMWLDDHPWPHFHAWFGGEMIAVHLADGRIVGHFPKRKITLVRRWLILHRAELYENWRLLRQDKQPRYIEPLD
jgi:hypothetical protein